MINKNLPHNTPYSQQADEEVGENLPRRSSRSAG